MADEIDNLLVELRALERTIEGKLEARRRAFNTHMRDGRVVFERSVIEHHRRFKTRLTTFLRNSPLIFYVTAPVIYALIVPFAFLDGAVTLFQWICFPAWNLRPVLRAQYIHLDRHRLAYLNG